MQNLDVVFIDDDEMILFLFEEIISSEGLTIRCFSNVIEAFDFVTQNEVKVVIVDYHMPQLDGLKFIMRCNGIKKHRSISYLFTGDYLTKGEEKLIKMNGCQGIIQKPTVIGDMISKINEGISLYDNSNFNQNLTV